jgi:DNA-binding transcriptional ArsR family regulator/uncharacterized protein YndB with AHSA1/START domain
MDGDDLTLVWKALSDPTRRTLLDLLRERPQTTGELCASFDVSRYAIMKHLTVLEGAGLVIVKRNGRQRWNHLNAVPIRQIYERWVSEYESHWAASLLKLKKYVENRQGEDSTMSETNIVTPALRVIHIEQEVVIEALPDQVFKALTQDVSAWWGAPYLYSETAEAMILEPKVGGRFYEDWGAGEGVLWGTVTQIKNNERLELSGLAGWTRAVQGIVLITLEKNGKATSVRLSHQAMGELDEQTRTDWSAGWQDLMGTRLRAFVERGIRYGIGQEPPPGIAQKQP